MVTNAIYFVRRDSALVRRRLRIGPSAEREPAQKLIAALMLAGYFLLMFMPGLDHRWQWSAAPAWLAIAADLGMAATFGLFIVVMNENSYAASTVQVEADQPVISTGPYAIVRHPMYAGALLQAIFIPLALGSYWSLLLLLLLFLPALLWRLLNEEKFLARNLPGYTDYCRKVRIRLIPGLW